MKKLIPFLLLTSTYILTIFLSGLVIGQTNKSKAKKDSEIGFNLSVPAFLRPCIEELVKQWQRTHGKGDIFIFSETTGSEGKEEGLDAQPLIKFIISPHGKKSGKSANATAQKDKGIILVGRPALAIYVNKANPLKGLTITQIDAIFSTKRRCGFPYQIETFGQLGLTGHWIDLKVIPFGLSSSPELNKWFQEACLCGGNLKNDLRFLDTNVDLFQAISTQPEAIGFYLFNRKDGKIKPLAISPKEGEDYFIPSAENIKSGTYPLSAALYATFNKKDLDKNARNFLEFCTSKKGQEIISSFGIVPIGLKTAK